MFAVTSQRKDTIASHLRFQIKTLQDVLKDIENEDAVDETYAMGTIKYVEKNLSQLRKLCEKYRLRENTNVKEG
jgi:hypothetical protein